MPLANAPALQDGFIMQVERLRFDGTSLFEAPLFWNTRDFQPTALTIKQTLERKAMSTWKETASDLRETPKASIKLEPMSVSEPFEISEMKGQIVDFGQKSGFQRVHWTTDGKFVVGLTKFGFTKLELSTGNAIASIRLPERITEWDLGRDGIIALCGQTAYLIDLDSMQLIASCWIPDGRQITAATDSSDVFAASNHNLYRVRWGDRAEKLEPTGEFQPRPFRLRDLQLTESGAHLLVTDGFVIHRLGVTETTSIRWEAATEKLRSKRGGWLYYVQGSNHVSLMSSTKSSHSHGCRNADYPSRGMLIYHVEELERPIYGAAFSAAYAIHPPTGGTVGGIEKALTFSDDRGRPLHTVPNARLLDAQSMQISPNGKHLFANMMRSVIVELPERFQDAVAFDSHDVLPRTLSIRKAIQRTDAGSSDDWNWERFPWDVSASEDMITWSADGQFFYVITSDTPENTSSPPPSFPKKHGDTVRLIHSSLLEGYATTFQDPVNFVGLSSEGLVVRYRDWQRVALLHPRTLKWIRDIGIPSPGHLATSPSSSRIWTRDSEGLHEYELSSGQRLRSYSDNQLTEIIREANLPQIPETEISTFQLGRQNPILRQSPDGKSLYVGYYGICKFDVTGEQLALTDCTGPSRDNQPFQMIYVSPDGSLVAKVDCSTNGKGKLSGEHSSGTIMMSSKDLGELKVDATFPGNCKGLALDPKTQTVFSYGSRYLLIKPSNASEVIEIPSPRTRAMSVSLHASPDGAGTFISFVNEAYWLKRKPSSIEAEQ
ncbi:MAG: hypothetical protein AAGI63_19910, partial [Planctomycetota bacterium]